MTNLIKLISLFIRISQVVQRSSWLFSPYVFSQLHIIRSWGFDFINASSIINPWGNSFHLIQICMCFHYLEVLLHKFAHLTHRYLYHMQKCHEHLLLSQKSILHHACTLFIEISQSPGISFLCMFLGAQVLHR